MPVTDSLSNLIEMTLVLVKIRINGRLHFHPSDDSSTCSSKERSSRGTAA